MGNIRESIERMLAPVNFHEAEIARRARLTDAEEKAVRQRLLREMAGITMDAVVDQLSRPELDPDLQHIKIILSQ